MANAIRVEGPVNAAGTTLSFETGKLARLADGAVFVQIGETTLLSTVATSKPREGIDFFPLTVDVEERMYADRRLVHEATLGHREDLHAIGVAAARRAVRPARARRCARARRAGTGLGACCHGHGLGRGV
jgi:hypothetical protein